MNGSIAAVLRNLKNGEIKNVVMMTGAGISCAAGIPDFRSSTGLYNTINPNLLTCSQEHKDVIRLNPTAVANIRLFERNPLPYLEIRRSFILGSYEKKWKPTISHYFAQLLHDKGILRRIYTQNTDGLDHRLNIPSEKIINFHGHVNAAECTFCKKPYPIDLFYNAVKTQIKNIHDPNDTTAPSTSTPILCLKCKRPGVKPSIVLFGDDIPRNVGSAVQSDFPENVDLFIVAGTSLTVSPACYLVDKVHKNVPKILINNESLWEEGINSAVYDSHKALQDKTLINSEICSVKKGRSESRANEIHNTLLGRCDEGFLTIVNELEWLSELQGYTDEMCEQSAKILKEY